MLIDCPHCEARVRGELIAEFEPKSSYEPELFNGSDLKKYVFLQCPSCHEPLLGLCEYFEGEIGPGGWMWPTRLWPKPDKDYDKNIPLLVHNSLADANKCLKAGVYEACAVMCGRAIELICKEKTGELNLFDGLKKLKSENLIDDRLYQWGEALRAERNIGAHASEETVTQLNAQDILDFANAIVEYIYVMSAKYEAYQNRKKRVALRKRRSAQD